MEQQNKLSHIGEVAFNIKEVAFDIEEVAYLDTTIKDTHLTMGMKEGEEDTDCKVTYW